MSVIDKRLGFGLAAACIALAGPAAAQDFYAGKRIQVIVPFSPGGATDVAARFLEKYLERHVPGNPDVEVVNRPGGGSVLGANWFAENAQPDGLTILFTTSSTSNPFVLGQEGVEYDLAAMRPGYSLPFGAVAYVSPTTGVTEATEVKDPDVPLIYGGIAAAASDLPGLLSFEVLGLDVKTVLGFPGRGPIRLAFERGETNLDYQFTPVYATQVVDMVAAGRATPLWTGGSVAEDGRLTGRDPAFPELPSVYEVYKAMNDGAEPSGLAWDAFQAVGTATYNYGLTAFLPEGTPDEAIAAFETAIPAINADPEFETESAQVVGGYALIPPSEVEGPLLAALRPSPEIRAYLRDLLSTKYGVSF